MKIYVLLLSLLFLSIANTALAETFKIDPAHSAINFKVRHILGAVTGHFRQFSGTIDLDREQPEQSSVNATIQVRSIDTGIAKRDQHLCSADFFNAGKFPEITFKSRNVRRTGKESGDVTGEFTMHGVTRTILLHVTLLRTADGTTRWRITTKPLKRDDYALRWSPTVETTSMIGQEVTVSMEVEASR